MGATRVRFSAISWLRTFEFVSRLSLSTNYKKKGDYGVREMKQSHFYHLVLKLLIELTRM